MTNDPANNPFSMVYTTLADLVWSYPDVQEHIRPGNYVRYDLPQQRDPLKDNITPGDMPEVVLMDQASTANIHSSSSTSMTRRVYSWMISTGDYRVTYSLCDIEWIIWVAMADWQSVLGQLKWPIGSYCSFCKKLDVIETTSGLLVSEQNRNLKGWSSIWQVAVEMHFRTADLYDEMHPPTP